jgi:hypothetical protein
MPVDAIGAGPSNPAAITPNAMAAFVRLRLLAMLDIHPSVFLDRGAAVYDSSAWRRALSAGAAPTRPGRRVTVPP